MFSFLRTWEWMIKAKLGQAPSTELNRKRLYSLKVKLSQVLILISIRYFRFVVTWKRMIKTELEQPPPTELRRKYPLHSYTYFCDRSSPTSPPPLTSFHISPPIPSFSFSSITTSCLSPSSPVLYLISGLQHRLHHHHHHLQATGKRAEY